MTGAAQTPSPIAVISGGSSGIGLHCAKELASRGYQVVLLARDLERLGGAQKWIELQTGRTPAIMQLDVCDAAATASAVVDIIREYGQIDWVITSAGIAEPGMFVDQDLASHRRQMETNYFGTLNLVHACTPHLRSRPTSRITLIASAAGFVGIAGYSAYAPSKFAVRALGEILKVELAQDNIQVGIAYPPDTDTPQLRAEEATKPAATKIITAGGGLMAPDAVAKEIIRQALLGRRVIAPSFLMQVFGWAHSLYAPWFLRRQTRILRKIARKHSGR